MHYCCSFVQRRYSNWKCSHLIARCSATETTQNTAHRRENIYRWCTDWDTLLLLKRLTLICLLLGICSVYLCDMTLLVVYQPGNAASSRNNSCIISPQRTPKPLITLFSVSHVPGPVDMLCESCRWRDMVKLASRPSRALRLT